MSKVNNGGFKNIGSFIQVFKKSLSIWLKLEAKTLPGKVNLAGVGLVSCFLVIFYCSKALQNFVLAFHGKSVGEPNFWGALCFIFFTIFICGMLLYFCERPKFKDI